MYPIYGPELKFLKYILNVLKYVSLATFKEKCTSLSLVVFKLSKHGQRIILPLLYKLWNWPTELLPSSTEFFQLMIKEEIGFANHNELMTLASDYW